MNFHSIASHCSTKAEGKAQVSIRKQWINWVWCICAMGHHAARENQAIDTTKSGKIWKHYGKWKEPAIKKKIHTGLFHLYKALKKEKYIYDKKKSEQWFPGSKWDRHCLEGCEGKFCGDGNVLHLVLYVATQVYTFVGFYWKLQLRFVHFSLCKFYLKKKKTCKKMLNSRQGYPCWSV